MGPWARRLDGWRASALQRFSDLLDVRDQRRHLRVNHLAGASAPEIADWLATQAWAPAIVERIVPVADPERIMLFGSRARGEPREDSDYDILVVADVQRRHRPRLRVECYRAVGDLPFTRDIIVATPAEVARANRLTGMLVEPFGASWRSALRKAAREGLVLYERPPAPRSG